MKKSFGYRFRRILLLGLLAFVVLFIFRLFYGYTTHSGQQIHQSAFFDSVNNLKRNYASKAYKVKSTASVQAPVSVDQKYEKIAQINTQSATFEQEEDRVRTQIKSNDALIQFEQKSGNKGNRRLNLLIGVPPERFDSLYQSLVQIGKVFTKQITKKDKTNEYKELTARKASLEKSRASLIDLKSKSGKIEEYIGLENRILDIEQQLQNIGVNLGDFDDENEFCTVQFSLIEGKDVEIPLIQRIKVALEWTVKRYLEMAVAAFFLALFAYQFLLALDKFRVLEKIVRKEQ